MTEQHPDQPEYLEPNAGGPVEKGPSSRRRRGLAVGGAVAALVLVGGGATAAWWWTSDGGDAADALPGDSLVFVGLTLDPSGEQKVEALSTLQKFPALAESLGLDGSPTDVDVKAALVGRLLEESGCDDVSYADDLEPWLGDRMGVSVRGGFTADSADVVVAVEVTDEDAADDGFAALQGCADAQTGGDGEASAVHEVRDGWLYVSDTSEHLDDALAALDEGSLADSTDYADTMAPAGDPGILSAYVSPGIQSAIADFLAEQGQTVPDASESESSLEGVGLQVRFADSSLEVQAGLQLSGDLVHAVDGRSTGGDVLTGLPSDTDAAFALGLPDDYVTTLATAMSAATGLSADELDTELQSSFGLGLDDVQGALGDQLGLALGPGLDLNNALASTSADAYPLALLLGGSADDVQPLLDVLNPVVGYYLGFSTGSQQYSTEQPDDALSVVDLPSGGSAVVTGNDYGDEVAAGGDLGSDPVFAAAVPDADSANGAVFVRLAGSDLAGELLAETGLAESDYAALSAVGGSVSYSDGVATGLLRITTTD
ncbi:DUF3352 domain-containing protein [Nocardioides sp. GY 10127]|uniref:DUF3352 domain-containing protein n=1 Tax=Nocardioides sp. GY 10127 TaxID=2569762 RepID=UPI0010A8E9B1|nr:DUF3352 domain-containing protein [Nocardioides sp. GY 10127]TIC80992.1 DUF3352 domain-containing protein [Nocardioides sp. GY 10127]